MQRERRGKYVVHQLSVTLGDSYNGATRKLALQKNVICDKCEGQGSPCRFDKKTFLCVSTYNWLKHCVASQTQNLLLIRSDPLPSREGDTMTVEKLVRSVMIILGRCSVSGLFMGPVTALTAGIALL
ncbi:DnaJ subfamily A member 1 [Galemys pyrenaicus]|uniref:DnaJ subfamily A member 1 n=1 Tax=Galemys pyrenaicus TaxID=202257 RepID=A0A8J6DIC8_GALPY|nr:DnaJ subfamily A member 1 [Galemys pyrenaicus]